MHVLFYIMTQLNEFQCFFNVWQWIWEVSQCTLNNDWVTIDCFNQSEEPSISIWRCKMCVFSIFKPEPFIQFMSDWFNILKHQLDPLVLVACWLWNDENVSKVSKVTPMCEISYSFRPPKPTFCWNQQLTRNKVAAGI